MNNQKKFKPANPAMVMLKVQQALIDNPNATYLEIKGFRRFKTSESVSFERGVPAINEYVPYNQDRTQEEAKKIFDKCVITKLYIPASAQIEIYDPSKKIQEWDDDLYTYPHFNYTVCLAEVPKEAHLEVLVTGVSNRELVVSIKNHILDHLHSFYKMVKTKKVTKVGLTEKNWKIVTGNPVTSAMIKLQNGKPNTKYVYSSAWKKPTDHVGTRAANEK